MPLIFAAVLALLVGVSLGLLGGGGSILTVPILRYALGVEAHSAVALSLLVVGTTSLAALVPHALAKRVRWRTAMVFGPAAMIGAFTAGRIAHFIPASVLLAAFGVMMLATAFAMLRGRKEKPAHEGGSRELSLKLVIAEGLVVGAVTGLVGAGGGFLVVPALVLLGGLPMDVAVGTSLVVIALKSFAGFAGFAGHTEIDWTLGAWISAAAVVGSVGGSVLASRIPADRLRTGFGWFVISMAFFILGQEVPRALGKPWPIALVILLALVGTGVALLVAKLAGRKSRPGVQGGELANPSDAARSLTANGA